AWRASSRNARVKNALKLGYANGSGCAASAMSTRYARTTRPIRKSFHGRQVQRVAARTMRLSVFCGTRYWRRVEGRIAKSIERKSAASLPVRRQGVKSAAAPPVKGEA